MFKALGTDGEVVTVMLNKKSAGLIQIGRNSLGI